MVQRKPKPIIGLAGGIGSGKSAVAGILAELGAGVIDSDRLAHQELSDPAVVRTLRAWWGDSVCHPDGTVDRARLAEIAFSSASDNARLAELIHPRVARRRSEWLARYRDDPDVCAIVIDSPLLFEAGLESLCDVVVFVEAGREVRRDRLRSGRGWSDDELHRREKFQKPLDTKRAKADYTVDNNSSVGELRPQVERLLSRILQETSPRS